jgi:hypothetical protein
MGAIFGLVNRHILLHRQQLLKHPIDRATASRLLRFAALGQIPYLAATVLAIVSPYVTLVICAGCAVYYALPAASRGPGDQAGASIA